MISSCNHGKCEIECNTADKVHIYCILSEYVTSCEAGTSNWHAHCLRNCSPVYQGKAYASLCKLNNVVNKLVDKLKQVTQKSEYVYMLISSMLSYMCLI